MERLLWHSQPDLRSSIWFYPLSDELVIILRSMMQCPDISMLVTGMGVTLRSAGLNRAFVWPHDRIGFAEWHTWYATHDDRHNMFFWSYFGCFCLYPLALFCQYVKCGSIMYPIKYLNRQGAHTSCFYLPSNSRATGGCWFVDRLWLAKYFSDYSDA